MVVAGKLPLRCAITDLCGAGCNSASSRRSRFVEQMRRWASQSVDFVQLREKSLDGGELLALARAAMDVLRHAGAGTTRLLVNGRPDIAAAAGAHGVHLPSRPGELTPPQVRRVFAAARRPDPFLSISCHTAAEVFGARKAGADLILFGPVFEKRAAGELVAEGLGLGRLSEAAALAQPFPLLALGGVTAENAPACLAAGAAGIAGIRLFA